MVSNSPDEKEWRGANFLMPILIIERVKMAKITLKNSDRVVACVVASTTSDFVIQYAFAGIIKRPIITARNVTSDLNIE